MSNDLPVTVRLSTSRSDIDVTAQIGDLSFRSTIPGGFASCTLRLNRPLIIQPDEISLFGKVYIYDGRHGGVLWEGSMEDPGRGAGGDGTVWSITAVGPSAHASDRTFPLIYVDQSQERWNRSQYSERSAITDKGEIDGDTPAMIVSAPEGTAISSTTPQWKGDFIYRAINYTGQKLARVRVSFQAGASTSVFQAGIYTRIGSASGAFTDLQNWATGTSNALGAYYGSVGWVDGMDVASIAGIRVSGSATASALTWINFFNVIVRAALKNADGTDITTPAAYTINTVKPAEVVADLLGRYLSLYDGAGALIIDSGMTIDQLAYPDGITAKGIFEDLSDIDPGFYWAAWESTYPSLKYRFEYIPWPTTIRYEATTLDGFDSPGSASELFNSVVVRWADARGKVRTRRRINTVPDLDAVGVVREAFIDLADETGTDAQAILIGDAFLQEHKYPPNAGTLTVARPILDNLTGRMVMPWEIRPGHLIRVQGVLPRVDALNPVARDGVTVFKIVSTDFSSSSVSAALELDSFSRSVARSLASLKTRRLRKR